MRYDHSAFPVDEYGRTIGQLTLRKVRRMPSDQWPASRMRDRMVPLGGQVVVPPDAPMDQVMAKIEDGEAGRVLAAEDGEVVRIITPSDLTRWLRRWHPDSGKHVHTVRGGRPAGQRRGRSDHRADPARPS
jgi:predicted transcriptional regulator